METICFFFQIKTPFISYKVLQMSYVQILVGMRQFQYFLMHFQELYIAHIDQVRFWFQSRKTKCVSQQYIINLGTDENIYHSCFFFLIKSRLQAKKCYNFSYYTLVAIMWLKVQKERIHDNWDISYNMRGTCSLRKEVLCCSLQRTRQTTDTSFFLKY